MPEDQKLRGLVRLIDMRNDEERATTNSLIEWETVTGVTAGAGASPTADTADGDDLTVLESYGFASRPAGTAQAIALAPGADDENRVALGLSSVTGRPATEAGDVVVWTGGGHTLVLDDDDGVTLTSKDGASVELDAAGAVTVNAGPNASVTVNVDGGQFVNLGGVLKLALGQATSDAIDAMLAGGVPAPNDGGVSLLATMTAAWNLVKASIQTTTTRGS